MSSIQFKSIKYIKKEDREGKKTIEAGYCHTQVTQLSDTDLKMIVINMFKMENSNEKEPMEILGLKNRIIEIKNSTDGFSSRLD